MDINILNNKEKKYIINSNYMENQKFINLDMRKGIIKKIFTIYRKENLHFETFCLSISILDRYSEKTNILFEDYDTISLLCVFISSKYVEYDILTLKIIKQYMITKSEDKVLLEFEKNILIKINFELTYPTVYHYLTILLNKNKINFIFVNFIFKVFLNIEYLNYYPSIIAASCIYILDVWNDNIYMLIKCNKDDIMNFVNYLEFNSTS